MMMDMRGTVRGGVILLERDVPGLEGKLVRVRLEVIDEAEPQASSDELRGAWAAWVAGGPEGPLEDEDEAAWQ